MPKRQRLTPRQKVQGVGTLLLNSLYQKSAHEMGRELGFVNGIPLYETLCELHKMGFIEAIHEEFLGKSATYFKVIETQREHFKEYIRSV